MKKYTIDSFFQTFVKLILFFSSYIPLILIIILQLIRVSLENIDSNFKIYIKNPSTFINIFKLKYIYIIIFLLLLCFLIVLLLGKIIKNTNDSNLKVPLELLNVQNINSSYITNYFSVYIFPFITLNMTLLDGLGTALILIFIIGYVYIKNDILYINPILNIIFKYNIYEVEIFENRKNITVTFLSKKDRALLKTDPNLSAYRIGYTLFIDI